MDMEYDAGYKEETYLFEDYEIFVHRDMETGEVFGLYTYTEDLQPDNDVTVEDDNPLNEFEWEQGMNKLFSHADNPKDVYYKLSKFFTKI